ncbi:DUF899 domain-containing protein [Actinomadura oligospora]|uniref:DUF899 domain-containing protein n=1 Tax=Actinomadura oligospora TaxID=111804 RepID=UPI0004ADB46B|nr:DUF899 domain-containing protein [Actinomadura oligospora]
MALPDVVTPEEWLAARKRLLEKEKELTRARDALNAERRRLPMVEIATDYVFEGPDGEVGLAGLFEGRRQLVVYHAMFAPQDDATCPSCANWLDQVSRGHLNHLRSRDTTFAAVSRAPMAKITPFRERMGWTFPWYSAGEGPFNYDFHVSLDPDKAPLEYNYRSAAEWKAHDWDPTSWEAPYDLHGLSCFLRDGDTVFHTYSAYGRGTEALGGSYYFLDVTALGRQEPWEEPKDRTADNPPQAGDRRLPYPDEYDV